MPPRRRPRRVSSTWRWLKRLWLLALGLVLLSALPVLALRWLDPPTTAFMLAWQPGEGSPRTLQQHWVPIEQIAGHLQIAVVASEDQKFPQHQGFDLDAIEDAWAERQSGARRRGASTISQQVAKNLFLWSEPSWVRKGLEVWFTGWIELLWSKQRILEVYLNIAEFGDGVYGAEAAATQFFDTRAASLSSAQAALLAAVLPNPKQYRAEAPGPYLLERRQWIERQMQQLGGERYLGFD